ncbi:hypothetical protein F0562_011617 [Nyssa sinensis]|uniref:Retrovirus-related Pol polyprotein from transposon TNT 1-94 n=1 Tax=Nyssa sinensis TaxID=561372 RepID=A0A5J4ZSY0_9ASTE|nr:hypothetical protein F0562_011617 [Nyssa sinensis]
MSRSHIVQLRNDFQRVKKDAAKSMKSYLDVIKQITNKLAATANLISDEEIVFVTLQGLPREYLSFKTAIRARETSITFEELSNLLLSKEINISMEELELNSPIGVSTALTAQKGSNQNYQGNYHNNRASSLPISLPSPPESLPSTPSPPLPHMVLPSHSSSTPSFPVNQASSFPHPTLPLNSLNPLASFPSSQSSSHQSPAASLNVAHSPSVPSSVPSYFNSY